MSDEKSPLRAVNSAGARQVVAVTSRVLLVLAVVLAVVSLGASWGINAEHGGAHDMGLAIGLVALMVVTMTITLYGAPVLLLLAAVTLFVDRRSALRLLVAAVVCVAPIAVASWLR